MRCFLAVALPKEIKEILRGLQGKLRTVGAGVRWVRPEGFHLTLKFFGEISEGKLPTLVQAAERTARDFEPFELALSEIGFFPEKSAPRVVWVGLSGELEPLLELHRKLEKAFKKVGFPPERRPFHPHLTLGRVKDPRQGEMLRRRAAELSVPRKTFRVKGLTFYRSRLHPEGAVYTALETVEFVSGGE